MPRIAARYIGHSPVILPPRPGDPYLDANGQPLQPSTLPNGSQGLILSAGDSLQVEEHELLGQTWLVDPTGARQPVLLGTGFAPLPQHAGKHWTALRDERFAHPGNEQAPNGTYYYEFHMGRSDFAPFTPHPRTFTDPLIVPAEPPAPATRTYTLPAKTIQASPEPTTTEE